jgi:adenylate kinase
MKLLFISGVSGVGKTTICNYIKDYIIAKFCINEDTDCGINNNNVGNTYER